MFLLNSFRAQHDLIQESFTIPGHDGLKLSFSHFDGYSPILDGSVRVTVVDSLNSEKSGSITVAIDVKASNPSYKDNIRIHKQDNVISISTGGLSLLSYTSAPRLIIDVSVSLPRSVGDLEIKTLSLPIIIQSIEKAGDIVLKTESSSITVSDIEARTLSVSSKSGAITFKELTKQLVNNFIKVTSSSGSIAIRSSLSSPSVLVEAISGSLRLAAKTAATELKIANSSGLINGDMEYANGTTSISKYSNISGSLNITLKEWTGFLTADSVSGGKNVTGQGLQRMNDGWKKGEGDSKSSFTTTSGSVNVTVL